MARPRNHRRIWILLILLLTALLLGLLAWVMLRPSGCGEVSCPPKSDSATEAPTTEAPTTEEPTTEELTTEEPTTEEPTTEEPTTEEPTTEEPTTEEPTTEQPTTEEPTTEEPTTEEPTTEEPTTEAPMEEPTTEAPATQPIDAVSMRVVTPVEVLSAPEGKPLQSLAIGETVTVTGKSGDWYELAESEGYVPTAALREKDHYVIVIDPGHQGKGNREKEPIGPGASEKKAKVASGTEGVATGIPEYKLTLQVSLKLRDLLESRGYEVVILRTDHDVNISNAERAQIANGYNADVFIRIHANGDSNPDIHGIMTLCQTENNPYNADLHPYSYRLSKLVLEEMVKASGGSKKFVWETDTMSGINWCRTPVTIVEMGYMSNPEEDRLMATEDYQNKLVAGMVNGIDAYFQTMQ